MKIKVKHYTPIINWCDRQARIYKNSPEIKWEGKVHETIKGFNTYSSLPKVEEWCLYHPKTIERQRKSNIYYENIIQNKII